MKRCRWCHHYILVRGHYPDVCRLCTNQEVLSRVRCYMMIIWIETWTIRLEVP